MRLPVREYIKALPFSLLRELQRVPNPAQIHQLTLKPDRSFPAWVLKLPKKELKQGDQLGCEFAGVGVCGCVCCVSCCYVCVWVLCCAVWVCGCAVCTFKKTLSKCGEGVLCAVLCCAAFTFQTQAHKTNCVLCVRHPSIQANSIASNSREAIDH